MSLNLSPKLQDLIDGQTDDQMVNSAGLTLHKKPFQKLQTTFLKFKWDRWWPSRQSSFASNLRLSPMCVGSNSTSATILRSCSSMTLGAERDIKSWFRTEVQVPGAGFSKPRDDKDHPKIQSFPWILSPLKYLGFTKFPSLKKTFKTPLNFKEYKDLP